jgi:hypothetical protein
MKVGVVILNWNRGVDTVAALKSLDKIRLPKETEILTVVVDNASTDDSLTLLHKLTSPAFRLVQNEKNLGYVGGNNVGIKVALEEKCDWVMVLNNDTLVDRDLLKEMLVEANKDKKVGLVSPKIYFAPGFEFHKDRYPRGVAGKVIWSAGGEMDWANCFGKNTGLDDVDRGQYDKVKEINFATGACLLIKAEVFEKAGLFNEKYYLYFEDVEFSQKVLKAGFKIIYVPQSVIWHKVAQSSGVGSDLNDYFITRNRLLFGLNYAPLRTKLALIKEAFGFLINGRVWQKRGVGDLVKRNFGKGGWR